MISDTQRDVADSTGRSAGWLAGLALLAAFVAAYLTWVAWQRRGLPLGCGENEGCAEVLTSRYAAVLGIPVGAPACALYVAMASAAYWHRRPWASFVLSYGAAAILVAAAWFLFLQASVIGAFCLWCVAEHLLGLVVAVFAIGQVRSGAFGPLDRRGRVAAALGTLSLAALAIVQWFQPARETTWRVPRLAGLAGGGNEAVVTLLQGHLRVTPADEPTLGEATAAHRLYLVFDYCCPHCRRTHEYLMEALDRYPSQLQLVCLPMPRDADCNAGIAETEERFEHACELAELALAVWRVNPAAFAEFDRWLFQPSRPPSPDEAREKARQLVPAAALERVLEGDDVARRIRRNVEAFNASQFGYLPVMMASNMDTMIGRPESREALLEVLETELLERIE